MSAVSPAIARRYAAALNSYLALGEEAALAQAYEIGRTALGEGVGLLDLALLHHHILTGLLIDHPGRKALDWMDPAALFFAECLAPFEMSLTGYREANQRLATAKADLEAAHAQLVEQVAEREKAEAALQQSRRLQAIGQLAGGIAHHFNNVLTVVMGNLHMARRRVSGDEKLERLLDSAAIGAERGATVTRQLLAFSRRQMLKPEVIDPSLRLGETAQLMAGALGGAITIECQTPEDLWPIEIDPTEFDLALINLGLNARDAMGGEGVLKVTGANRRVGNAALGLDGDYVVIEVADSGTGITPENLPRVFDPFFTTKGAGGTGMGLSQVHGFANQSGGAVEIQSEPDRGTKVRLYLPAAARPSVGESQPVEDDTEIATDGAARATVLVVDDDVDVAGMAAALLEDSGFAVKLAYRAKAALDVLLQEHVDLLFSDIVMPDGMDGLTLAAEVRRLKPTLPILLTTGYAESIVEGRPEAKSFPILAKPYKPNDLRRGVLQLLEHAA